MKTDDKAIEERTFSWFRKLKPDEPSAEFTQKVMQAILSTSRPSYLLRRKNYLWAIVLVPVIIIISWGFIVIFNGKEYMDRLWIDVHDSIQPFLDMFRSIFSQLKDISIQSTIFVSFLVILSLLVFEEFLSRMRHFV
jgi:hypothetical protein